MRASLRALILALARGGRGACRRAPKARKPIVRRVRAGRGSVALARALRRVGLLKPGTLRLSVIATDAAGNRSAKRVLQVRIS